MSTLTGHLNDFLIDNVYSGDLKGVEFFFDKEEGYEVKNPDDTIFVLYFDVTMINEDAGSTFTCTVCTPNYVANIRQGSKLIILERYSYSLFRKDFLDAIRKCNNISPYETMKNLRKRFEWEYEGKFDEAYLKKILMN